MAEPHCMRCDSLQDELDNARRVIAELRRATFDMQERLTRLQHLNEKLTMDKDFGHFEGRSYVTTDTAGTDLGKKRRTSS